MLRLSESQWAALQAQDARNFVAAACEQFLCGRSPALGSLDRAAVRGAMQAAYEQARNCGFTSTPHVLRLMFLAAGAPALLQDPALRAWLTRPGDTPERRLDDLRALMQHKLKGQA